MVTRIIGFSDRNVVINTAKLARIKLNEEEILEFKSELIYIQSFIDTILTLDLPDTQPNVSLSIEPMKMREDVVTEECLTEDLMKSAPASLNDYYIVPKIID